MVILTTYNTDNTWHYRQKIIAGRCRFRLSSTKEYTDNAIWCFSFDKIRIFDLEHSLVVRSFTLLIIFFDLHYTRNPRRHERKFLIIIIIIIMSGVIGALL
jgi:hypothetical protein